MPETRRVRAFADRLVVAEDLLERVVGECNELREENARLRRLVARLVIASEELAAEAPAVLPGGGEEARAAVRAANQDAICELRSAMPDLDPTTGYPPGYVPGWWRCLECGERWHDSEQQGLEIVVWEVDPECGPCGTTMVREEEEA